MPPPIRLIPEMGIFSEKYQIDRYLKRLSSPLEEAIYLQVVCIYNNNQIYFTRIFFSNLVKNALLSCVRCPFSVVWCSVTQKNYLHIKWVIGNDMTQITIIWWKSDTNSSIHFIYRLGDISKDRNVWIFEGSISVGVNNGFDIHSWRISHYPC